MRSNADDPHRDQPVLQRGAALNSAMGAVVLLHGRGSSAEDILGLAQEFDLPELAYLAPEAAEHTWYPYSFLSPIELNQPWLDSALNLVAETLQRAITAGIERPKIAIVGFSQGACLAMEFVARNAARYGGLVAFTGGLIGPPGARFVYSGELSGTACFLGAGDRDPHVPWKRVEETASVLSGLGAVVTLRRYPGLPHTINEDEIDHAKTILRRLIVKDRAV
ncbi:MAG: phospholipase [Acidobacteria bacterium]|nr:MAG: phospholipase [Acidobacteriota bacterium]